jgi:ribosomal protein L25 (general stress protein Ctc)
MEEIKIKAELRKSTGKGTARKLRKTGKIPAVLYEKISSRCRFRSEKGICLI